VSYNKAKDGERELVRVAEGPGLSWQQKVDETREGSNKGPKGGRRGSGLSAAAFVSVRLKKEVGESQGGSEGSTVRKACPRKSGRT